MSLSWNGTVNCEGGPIVVADVDAWSNWLGAEPFSRLRTLQGLPADVLSRLPQQRVIHYWGHFTGELPEPFTWTEGHRFLECATEVDAFAQLNALRTAVTRKFRGTLSADPDGFGFVREDGRRLTAELAPSSAYDVACQAATDVAWEHLLGPVGAGLFWEMEGGGTAEVAMSVDGRELVLVRSWLSGDDATVDAERDEVHALIASRPEQQRLDAHLSVTSGRVIAAWSPMAPFDLANVKDSAALESLIDAQRVVSLDTDVFGRIALGFTLTPGRYRASVGRHDAERWSCHWCRLTLAEGRDRRDSH